MIYSDPVLSLLDNLDHAGPLPKAVIHGRAGHAQAGSAVQFSLTLEGGAIGAIRYWVIGSPVLMAACEYWARRVAQATVADLPQARPADWLAALGLPRTMLSQLLLVDDAWRDVCEQLATQRMH